MVEFIDGLTSEIDAVFVDIATKLKEGLPTLRADRDYWRSDTFPMTAHLTLYISGIINGADVSLGISAHATPDELRVTYNVWSGLGEESVDLTEGDITNINLGDGTEARNRQLADFVGRALAVFKNCYQMILDELRRKLVGRSETDSSGIGGLDQNEDWLLHFDYDRTKTWSW